MWCLGVTKIPLAYVIHRMTPCLIRTQLVKPSTKPSTKNKQEANLSKRLIKAIASAITKMQMSNDHDSDGSDDEEVPMKPPTKKAKIQSNRTNPALSRN